MAVLRGTDKSSAETSVSGVGIGVDVGAGVLMGMGVAVNVGSIRSNVTGTGSANLVSGVGCGLFSGAQAANPAANKIVMIQIRNCITTLPNKSNAQSLAEMY